MKSKELVSLRTKAMKNGGSSLFLDYSIDGVRTKEYLKMYLVPERTRADRIQNEETMKIALTLKSQKIVDIQKGEAGYKIVNGNVAVGDYIESYREELLAKRHMSMEQNMRAISRWVELYDGGKTPMAKVTLQWVRGLFDFMSAPPKKCRWKGRAVSQNSLVTYCERLSGMFNRAKLEGYMAENPMIRMPKSERPKRPDTSREYLTKDEIARVAEAECGCGDVKRAFLFACFTGLRLGDIETLTWDNIIDNGEGKFVAFRMHKTKKMQYVPLSENAITQLPPQRMTEKVFTLPVRTTIAYDIRRLMENAGIGKRITFHCARHTFATLLLTYGADLYVTSKLLGHSSIKTTEIYARIVDSKKKEAVNLIPTI